MIDGFRLICAGGNDVSAGRGGGETAVLIDNTLTGAVLPLPFS